MERHIGTVAEAQKALAEKKETFYPVDSSRKARKRNTLLNYAEAAPATANIEEISLDLDEL